MGVTEILGFVTGAACVWLAARENIWNWPIGIANNVFFLFLFWNSKLYADAGLQIIYILISVFGWWQWARGGDGKTQLPVSHVSNASACSLVAASVVATAFLYWLLHRFTDSSVPFGDAVTTALSLTAQYMMSRKFLENWLIWIAADLIYIALYFYKALYLTSVLYAVFLAMCVVGYIRWRHSIPLTSYLPVAAGMAE